MKSIQPKPNPVVRRALDEHYAAEAAFDAEVAKMSREELSASVRNYPTDMGGFTESQRDTCFDL